MPTNLVELKKTDEIMNDYQPSYQPLYSMFLENSQAYSEQVGVVNFHRKEVIGDIDAREITPKDTEIKQISVGSSKKAFNKYFLGNQFQQSTLQSAEEVETVIKQVLDHHQKQADVLLEGTAHNSGLFVSSDSNYVTNSSAVAGSFNQTYDVVDALIKQASSVMGPKVVLAYGLARGQMTKLHATQPTSPIKVLKESHPDVSFVDVPDEAAPAGASGFIIVTKNQVKLHYTTLPEVKAQGTNEENMYVWTNFLMGSMMLEVLVKKALIKQPITLS